MELFWSAFFSDFPAFGLNTLYSVRMRENPGKMQARITSNTDSFYAVHLPQILILLKGFHRKSTVKNNSDYERNYRFFNGNKFKNVLKSIPLENILSKVNLSASSAIRQVFSNLYEKMHTHAY